MINPNFITSATGRLVQEPDYRQTDRGTAVCRFTIAIDMGKDRKPEYVDCKAFRQTADFVDKYFGKGKWISAIGTFETDEYTDKNGQQKKKKELIVDNVAFCGARETAVVKNEDGTLDISEEDLPF